MATRIHLPSNLHCIAYIILLLFLFCVYKKRPVYIHYFYPYFIVKASCTVHNKSLTFSDAFIIVSLHCLAGSCECGNEPSGSAKCGEFLD